MLADLQKLAARKLIEARCYSVRNIDLCEAMIARARDLGKQAGIEINIPDLVIGHLVKGRSELKSANYFEALEINKMALEGRNAVMRLAKDQLEEALNRRKTAVNEVKKNITEVT
jgi:hypothetical protein